MDAAVKGTRARILGQITASSRWFYLPLADVENPRPSNDHREQFLLQTLMAGVLQRPIPDKENNEIAFKMFVKHQLTSYSHRSHKNISRKTLFRATLSG